MVVHLILLLILLFSPLYSVFFFFSFKVIFINFKQCDYGYDFSCVCFECVCVYLAWSILYFLAPDIHNFLIKCIIFYHLVLQIFLCRISPIPVKIIEDYLIFIHRSLQSCSPIFTHFSLWSYVWIVSFTLKLVLPLFFVALKYSIKCICWYLHIRSYTFLEFLFVSLGS